MAFADHKIITIPAGNVTDTVIDFPLLVYGTFSYLAHTSHGGLVTSVVGDDIVFTSDIAGTIILPFERINYDTVSGAIEYRVKVQTTSGVACTIYAFYGDASIVSYQGNNTGTWNAVYKSVYHFADGVTLNTNDSTINANTGTPHGGAAARSGQINGAAGFTANPDYISVVNSASLRAALPHTFRFWVYLNNYHGPSSGVVSYFKDGLTNFPWIIAVDSSGHAQFQFVNGAINPSLTDTTVIPLNTWTQVTMTVSGITSVSFYINGSFSSTQSTFFSVPGASTGGPGVFIGGDGSAANLVNGGVDEFWIYSGVMTANHISMLWSNEFNPSAFYGITSNNHYSETAAGVFILGGTAEANMGIHSSIASGQLLLKGTANPSQGFHSSTATGQLLLIGHAQATEGYHSATASGQLLLEGSAISTVGEVPLDCVTGDGTGGPVAPVTPADLSYSY